MDWRPAQSTVDGIGRKITIQPIAIVPLTLRLTVSRILMPS
jgi:hypothetical protein